MCRRKVAPSRHTIAHGTVSTLLRPLSKTSWCLRMAVYKVNYEGRTFCLRAAASAQSDSCNTNTKLFSITWSVVPGESTQGGGEVYQRQASICSIDIGRVFTSMPSPRCGQPHSNEHKLHDCGKPAAHDFQTKQSGMMDVAERSNAS